MTKGFCLKDHFYGAAVVGERGQIVRTLLSDLQRLEREIQNDGKTEEAAS